MTTKELEVLSIESYLPLFNGFYGSLLECDCEELEEGEEFNSDLFDYADYYDRISKSVTEFVGNELKDLEIKVEFQALVSPKYYNFSNDSINVKYTLSENTITLILAMLSENNDDFEQYLHDNYTCRDGFIPFHSNDKKEWLLALTSGSNELLGHKLGGILNFYLTVVCELSEMSLMEHCSNEGEFYISRK